MNRKNGNKNKDKTMKMKKVSVNVPTKMNMKKGIEATTKRNRIEDGHEDECEDEHECENEDEHEREQCRWRVFSNVLMLPMEPGDHCRAPMSNDCQACGSAQAHMRQSIPWEYPPRTKIDAANTKQMLSISGYPGNQIKAEGAGGDRQNVRLQ
jgi:hypothetical protein